MRCAGLKVIDWYELLIYWALFLYLMFLVYLLLIAETVHYYTSTNLILEINFNRGSERIHIVFRKTRVFLELGLIISILRRDLRDLLNFKTLGYECVANLLIIKYNFMKISTV